jgi:DNA-binding response OmpR family regulator
MIDSVATAAGRRASPHAHAPLRLLIADDERDTVDMLTVILRDEGHVVYGLYTGKEVMPAVGLFRPDAMIMDIAIPGVSGYAVAQAVRHSFTDMRRPLLIAITGQWKETPDRMVALQVGFDHHLIKPCDPAQIIDLLEPLRTAGFRA